MPETAQQYFVHQGGNIKLARKFKGVKHDDLAKRLNISTATLSRLENQQNVDDEMLKNISMALDVNLDALKSFSLEKEFSTQNNVHFHDAVNVSDGGDNIGVKQEHNAMPLDILNRILEEAEEKGILKERNRQLAEKLEKLDENNNLK